MQGKVEPTNSATAAYAGIDVSKDWLEVYVHPAGLGWRVENSVVGLRRLRRHFAELDLPIERVLLEATGKYHRQAHRTLSCWGYPVAVVNPLRARLFAQACGASAKTDRIDARLLALMGQSLVPAPSPLAPQQHEHLKELVNARTAASAGWQKPKRASCAPSSSAASSASSAISSASPPPSSSSSWAIRASPPATPSCSPSLASDAPLPPPSWPD